MEEDELTKKIVELLGDYGKISNDQVKLDLVKDIKMIQILINKIETSR